MISSELTILYEKGMYNELLEYLEKVSGEERILGEIYKVRITLHKEKPDDALQLAKKLVF